MRILLSAIYPYIFVMLFLVIPFDDYIRAWPNILLIVLTIIFPWIVRKSDFKKLKTFPVVTFFVFILFLVFNGLIHNRFSTDFNILGKILIALLLLVLYIPINDIQKVKNAVIFSSLAAIVYSVYHFVLITHDLGYFVLGDSPEVIEALLIDRVYLGLLSAISILISFHDIRKRYHPLNSYYLANIAINIIFIFLIASRITLLALVAVLIIRQFYRHKKIWGMAVAGIAGIGIVGMFYLIKNKEQIDFQNSMTPKIVSNFITNSNTYELRSYVWNCVSEIAEENHSFWTGNGFKNTENMLVACYESDLSPTSGKEEFISKRYNTHNQFLDFYLSAGLLGILIFVLFLFSSFRWTGKQFFPTSLLLLLMIYFSFENLFHRQIGAYYVGLILLMTLIAPQEKPEDAEEIEENKEIDKKTGLGFQQKNRNMNFD